jgi:hypothetical protein
VTDCRRLGDKKSKLESLETEILKTGQSSFIPVKSNWQGPPHKKKTRSRFELKVFGRKRVFISLKIFLGQSLQFFFFNAKTMHIKL